MKNITTLTTAFFLSCSVSAVAAGLIEAAKGVDSRLVPVFTQFLPGNTGLGKVTIDAVKIDNKARVITVNCNTNAAYIPLTQKQLAELKNGIRNALGSGYSKYKVTINAVTVEKGKVTARKNFDDLYLFAPKKTYSPTEKDRFVTDLGAQPAPAGLDGANIALWQSHGWYFEPKLNRWEWQRARIFQTVEDLYPQSYVMPYLMPMLRNAGAYVMSPRERDVNVNEVIVDNDGNLAKGRYSESGKWQNADAPGFGYTEKILKDTYNPFKSGTARVAKASTHLDQAPVASWNAEIPQDGEYAVYVSYQSLPNSAPDALYRVNSKEGTREFRINQTMGGGTWIYLGHFSFDKGAQSRPVVELVGQSHKSGKVVSADAVKIGGGMGNVARAVKNGDPDIDYEYITSKYPRFTEGARYFLQWAGAPDSVYTPSGNVNDYTDDYRSRGLWVNWLAGGSSALPDAEGLRIPVDLSFAFHTDAGTTMNDSIIGTLGIYCTAQPGGKDGYFANGTSRLASRDFTDLVMTSIVNDVRAKYEPNWTRRGMWDQSYYEARVPEVPGMLLEFLSHQNFADMKYGLDPAFRFDVSRAIYKGMLKFIAHRDGRDYTVTPLAPRNFAITGTDGKYLLSWQMTPDSLEQTAVPAYYIVEERTGDGGFRQIARVEATEYAVNVSDSDIHSYRIIAGNDGGVSFPSEVLALCHKPGAPVVNIVNGFTRVSAPDWFDSGEIAGFYDQRDPGVPDVMDINYIGPMFEYRRDIPWMDDDAAGFGASRANYEDKVIAGNTHDFVYVHGKAVADAGYGFVSSSVGAFMSAPVSDGEPKVVDLILGKQKEIKRGTGYYGTYYKTFPGALQDKLRAYTGNGGNVFVSGAFVATDLWDNPNSSKEVAEADQKFATEVLGYHWRVGQATVEGQATEVQSRYKAFDGGDFEFHSELNGECYAAESPDSFYAPDAAKGATIMRYTENNLVAGTCYAPGAYRTVVIGFPFETIKTDASRSRLMRQVLSFFENK